MLRASLLLALSASAASAASAASEPVCHGPACQGEEGGGLEAEASVLLQVHRASAEPETPYINPCPKGYNPKASTKEACSAANLKYTGNTNAVSTSASHCCVPQYWTCNMGDEKYCETSNQTSKYANPTFLGDTAQWWWDAVEVQGNCCLPPNPASAQTATWTMDTRMNPSDEGCKTTEVKGKTGSPSYTLIAFWTGEQCPTTANVGGTYYAPTCTTTSGGCSGVDIGEGMCCYYNPSR